MARRLSLCYAAPGHFFLPEVGPSLNVLSVGEALSRVADVTLAFRKTIKPVQSPCCEIVELDPEFEPESSLVDDSAVRGTRVTDFVRYLGALRKFVEQQCHRFDIILEKSWLFSGYLTHAFQRRGVPGILVENLVRIHDEPATGFTGLQKYLRYSISQAVVRHYARKASAIIAETDALKVAIRELWHIPDQSIEVVELGVDRRLFHPVDQQLARQSLGMKESSTILLYVGVLDRCHNLAPAIEALNRAHLPNLELHVLGDGLLREAFEAIAVKPAKIFFHGPAPHAQVPQFIAAADLCIAPYEPTAFVNGRVSFSTLKILEYMACARPVVSVSSGRILTLIKDGLTGFLFPNTTDAWSHFLDSCPPRSQLKKMGVKAECTVANRTWERTAEQYLAICDRVLRKGVNGTVSS